MRSVGDERPVSDDGPDLSDGLQRFRTHVNIHSMNKISNEEIVGVYETGMSAGSIAKSLGKSTQAVLKFLKRRGVSIRRPEVMTPEDEETARAAYMSGLSIAEVVKKTGLKESVARAANAGSMRTPSETLSLRKGKSLNRAQEQCVLGTLLGDSCLGRTYLTMVHSWKQRDYIEHKRKVLDGPTIRTGTQRNGSYSAGSSYVRMDYCNKIGLDPIREMVLVQGKKRVTEKWLSKIDIDGIAYWFMDDGSSSWTKSGRAYCGFATYGFDREANDLLVCKLRSIGVDARIHKTQFGHGSKIGIPVSGSQVFLKSMEETISKVPCMAYKLKLVQAEESSDQDRRLKPVIGHGVSSQ